MNTASLSPESPRVNSVTDRRETMDFLLSFALLGVSGVNWAFLNHVNDLLRLATTVILFLCACATGASVARRLWRKWVKGEKSTAA